MAKLVASSILKKVSYMPKKREEIKAKNRWFRFYSEVLNDHKVQSLSPENFRHWVNLLCIANECDGVLPSMSEIAFKLRMSEDDACNVTETLRNAELIDVTDDQELFPHNWSVRQYKSDCSTERVRKHRKATRRAKKDNGNKALVDVTRNVSLSVTETPPDTESEADTESETEAEKDTEKIAASCCCNTELIWIRDVFGISEPEATEWLIEQIEIYGEGRVQAGVADYRRKFDSGGLQTHSMRTLRGFISAATPQTQQSDEPEHMRVYREMRAKQLAEQANA